MIADLSNMPLIFHECNMEYFGGELLFPRFEILHSFRVCGHFEYISTDWKGMESNDPVLSITDHYEFSRSQFVDIMCHEMVHYYLAWTGKDKWCRHGKEFMKMSEMLNKKYGLNVTKTVDVTQCKRRKGTPLIPYLWSQISFI